MARGNCWAIKGPYISYLYQFLRAGSQDYRAGLRVVLSYTISSRIFVNGERGEGGNMIIAELGGGGARDIVILQAYFH